MRFQFFPGFVDCVKIVRLGGVGESSAKKCLYDIPFYTAICAEVMSHTNFIMSSVFYVA